MSGDAIVFFPKYVTLGGNVNAGYQYYSDPYDLTEYNQLDVEVFVAALTGGTPSVDVSLQESSDMETWNTIGSATTINTNGSSSLSAQNYTRYVRLAFDNWGATDNFATLWAKGVARNT